MDNVVSEIISRIDRDHYSNYDVISLEFPEINILKYVDQVSGRLFVSINEKEARMALGTVFKISKSGKDRIQQAKASFNEFQEQFSGKRIPIYGGISFDGQSSNIDLWTGLEQVEFFVPQLEIVTVNGKSHVNIIVTPNDTKESLRNIITNYLDENIEKNKKYNSNQFQSNRSIEANEYALDQWIGLIENAQSEMKSGVIEKVVLARCKDIQIRRQADFRKILKKLTLNYPHCFTFLYRLNDISFFGASPELLFDIVENNLKTMALAGTIKRGSNGEEDQELSLQLLEGTKDLHEHQVVVDEINQVLRLFSTKISYDHQPHIRKLHHIQHLETKFNVILDENSDIFAILSNLHPTPALGGKPKEKSIEFIRKHEPMSRGFYASPLGWIDNRNNSQFFVAIRSGVIVNQQLRLYAGAGIVEQSVPEYEWEEIELKFLPILNAMEEYY